MRVLRPCFVRNAATSVHPKETSSASGSYGEVNFGISRFISLEKSATWVVGTSMVTCR